MAQSPEIDLTKLNFPSDGLTLGTLRRLHPEHINTRESVELLPKLLEHVDEDVSTMMHAERFLANAAFHISFGGPVHPENIELLKDYAKELSKSYVRHRIASGPHHAEQLIRGIEIQASEQARQYTGRRP